VNQNFKLFDIDGGAIMPDFVLTFSEFGKVVTIDRSSYASDPPLKLIDTALTLDP